MKRIWLIAAVCIAALACTAMAGTAFVQVNYADVYLRDLPKDYEGTRVLYMTDIPEKKTGLLAQLSSLAPDYVLLGGGLPERDNDFYAQLSEYYPNACIYAAFGEKDVREGCRNAKALVNNFAYQNIDGKRMAVVGLDAWNSGERQLTEIAAQFSEDDCVIVMTSDAQSLAAMGGTACRDGSRWADLVLAPETEEKRYPVGWTQENGSTLLVSKGACSWFGGEVHLITLFGRE